MQKLFQAFLLLLVVAVLGIAAWLWTRSAFEELEPLGPGPAQGTPAAVQADGPLLEPQAPAPGAEPEFERVVLVSIDTVRADHLPFHGYPRDTTPFLRNLAERGVVFERAHAAISHTGPSHATMLTGLPPILHGVQKNGDKLDLAIPDLGQLFSSAGFETAAYLSVGFLGAVAGGFDHVQSLFKPGDELVDDAIHWLREKRGNERFFLWFHLYEPHEWYLTEYGEKEHVEAVRATSELEGRAFYNYIEGLHGLRAEESSDGFEIEWTGATGKGTNVVPTSPEHVVRFVDSYDGLLRQADGYVERLYHALEALELPGRTLWIVTSDHGEGLGSHGYSGHGAKIYGEQLAVPLVFHASDDSLAPRRVATPAHHTDLLPTLAEMLGARVDSALPGVLGHSLRDLLHGEATVGEARRLFAQRKQPRNPEVKNALFSLQTAQGKLLWFRDEGREEFYDLRADPGETEDLAGRGSELQEGLRRHLRAQLELFEELGPGRSSDPIPSEVLEELRRLGYTD